MAEYGSKEYNKILKDFGKGRQWLNDVVVEIVGGETNSLLWFFFVHMMKNQQLTIHWH